MRIPTPAERGQPVGGVTVDALQPVFQNTQFANNQELSQNLSSLGNSLGNTASILDKRRKDLDTRAAQAEVDRATREITNPQTGILSRRGAAAKGSANEIDSIMAGVRGNLNLDGLQGSSRQAVETLLKTRTEELYNRVAQFELGQLDVYDRELSEARVAGAADTAAADPLNNDAYQTGYLQAHDAGVLMAEQQGAKQGDALYDQIVKKQTSTVVLSRVDALANTSANGAKDFLEAAYEAGHIDATSYNATKAALQPRIIEENATSIATQALAIRNGDSLIDPASPIMGLIHSRESGSGGYRALYDQGQTSRFSNVDITKMTVRQLQDFSDPSGSYGQWVKPRLDPNGYAAKNGLTSTPMGKYQIVGGTLDSLIEEMGLTGDEMFDEAMQDKMFATLMQRRLSASTTVEGKREGMRNEWEGFRSVPDSQLDAAIAAFESGDGGNYATPEDRIAAEPDMETRQLAQRLFNAEAGAQNAAEERERVKAVDGFYATMDSMSAEDLAGVTWDQMLNQTERDILGSDVVGLRNWFLAKKAGEDIKDEDPIVQPMLDNAAGVNGPTGQAEFMKADLSRSRASMSDRTYYELLETQRTMKANTVSGAVVATPSALTPTITSVDSAIKSVMGQDAFKKLDATAASRLRTSVMIGLQKRGATIPADKFEGWSDLELITEVQIQSTNVKVNDGARGPLNDQTVPLYQLAAELEASDALGTDLIASAMANGGGGLSVGGYVISPEELTAARDQYLVQTYPSAQLRSLATVYADDLLYFMFGELIQDERILLGIDGMASQGQAAALAPGLAASALATEELNTKADALAAELGVAPNAALDAARQNVDDATALRMGARPSDPAN